MYGHTLLCSPYASVLADDLQHDVGAVATLALAPPSTDRAVVCLCMHSRLSLSMDCLCVEDRVAVVSSINTGS